MGSRGKRCLELLTLLEILASKDAQNLGHHDVQRHGDGFSGFVFQRSYRHADLNGRNFGQGIRTAIIYEPRRYRGKMDAVPECAHGGELRVAATARQRPRIGAKARSSQTGQGDSGICGHTSMAWASCSAPGSPARRTRSKDEVTRRSRASIEVLVSGDNKNSLMV